MQKEVKGGGPGKLDYRGRDRFGVAVAVAAGGHPVVVSGPLRIDAYAGETITWILVNASAQKVTFEFAEVRALDEGPKDPFTRPPAPVTVEPGLTSKAKGKLVATVLPEGKFAAGRITRYQYVIRIAGVADSAADPELDIYP
jgi:hypothetical protein